MSLIVATNRIDENTLQQSSEKPSNFKNFFRSPIEIEPNSEIAVQSVKIQRSGNVVIGNDDTFCHYFGTLPETINDVDSLTCLSRTIKPKRGAYSLSGYEKEIQRSLNEQYDDPRTFGGYLVSGHTNASGEELGLEISCVDRGEATTNVIDNAAISPRATFNIANPYDFYTNASIAPSDGFTFTAASGSATFTRTASTATVLQDSRAVGILGGIPFGLNDGELKVEVNSASAQPYAIGLSRPQIQVESYENSQISGSATLWQRHDGVDDLDGRTAALENNETDIINSAGNFGQISGTYETYDYAFYLDEDDNITIAERVFDVNDEVSRMQELAYWENGFTGSTGSKLTKAQFHASWDGIQYKGKGDEIELYFKQSGKDVFDVVVASTLNEGPGNSFSPIGSTSYALYPQMNVLDGSLKITKYEGPGITTYKYPTFETGTGFTRYTPGDDCFSNEAVVDYVDLKHYNVTRTLASNSVDQVVYRCDSSDQKLIHADVGGYVYSNLNSANGVDFVHLFTVNRFTKPVTNDTLTSGQEFPNMGGRLGFRDRTFLISNDDAGYVSGDDTLTIKFTSTSELNKTNIASFIRIPNLTHKSFNGGQSGLSKILYQLPQFANGGNQYGSLYFEPGEKTYVKLHNPAKMILNMLQVQVVDSHEKELDSLTGDTQIVFHVRQSKM